MQTTLPSAGNRN